MKNDRIIAWLFTALICCATAIVSGQTPWNTMSITGSSAKIKLQKKAPRWHFALLAKQPMNSTSNQSFNQKNLKLAFSDPATAAQLNEQLGAEYFPGSYTGAETDPIVATQVQLLTGIRMGHRILEHWELRLAAIWLKEQGTGTFMGTVAPAGQLPPSSQQGKLHTSSTGLLADTEIAYRIGNRRVQALFTTGFRTSAPVHQTYNAELAGLQIPFNSSLPQPSISPLAGVSLRWRCIKTTFIETGVTFGRIKNIGWKPTVDFGLGVGF